MGVKVILLSKNNKELSDFLTKFYSKSELKNDSFIWQQYFSNPIEITDLIAGIIDNDDIYKINMWITLDEDVFIRISHSNANNIIKYLFERYPY